MADYDGQFEDEGVLSRDQDNNLIRAEKATIEDFETPITFKVNGISLTVRKARPTLDSQGNPIVDSRGYQIPRFTTIYDAIDESGRVATPPTLCHKDHLPSAGVCRVCSVGVYKPIKDGKNNLTMKAADKLIPACHHQVMEGIEVHTANSEDKIAQRVQRSVRTLSQLLSSDHLKPSKEGASGRDRFTPYNELANVAFEFDAAPDLNRFDFSSRGWTDPSHRIPERKSKLDVSSHVVRVDHSACILCERCVRACSDVRENFIIGRTGKGYTANIGFDLDVDMGKSDCVECGECMVSCPTDALTFQGEAVKKSDWFVERMEAGCKPVKPEELLTVPPGEVPAPYHTLFKDVPYKFLDWNAASIVRRNVKKGELLCRQGDYGTTAFIIKSGVFQIYITAPDPAGDKNRPRPLDRFLRRLPGFRGKAVDNNVTASLGEVSETRNKEDLILGEMTCMSHQPRSATVKAVDEGEVYEIRRNVLYVLQQDVNTRRLLQEIYSVRALNVHLGSNPLLTSFPRVESEAYIEFLQGKVELMRLRPNQILMRKGKQGDDVFLIHVGHVKITDGDTVLAYRSPGDQIGEIALLTDDDDDDQVATHLPDQKLKGKRTATCQALDDVELVQIPQKVFRALCEKFPKLKAEFQRRSIEKIQSDQSKMAPERIHLNEFVKLGLYNANALLVLDLESCTRCDECTKACSDTHDNVSKLIRTGDVLGKYLVASACRSCTDPYCLVGCPVDAIHRLDTTEVIIADNCIGCGQCAKNCPYGNINIINAPIDPNDPNPEQPKFIASTCDLCQKQIGNYTPDKASKVSCVRACPHEAAFRMTGRELEERILAEWSQS